MNNKLFKIFAGLILISLLGMFCINGCEAFWWGNKNFITVGKLNEARTNHTATLLNNGTVLITGGQGNALKKVLCSIEIYNPKTQEFTLTNTMHFRRTDHSAVKLEDGDVLIFGGRGYPETRKPIPPEETIYAIERYHAKTGKITIVGEYPKDFAGRPYDYKLLPNNKILITAQSAFQRYGLKKGEREPSDAYIYDVDKNTFTSVGLHQQERPGAAVFLSNNKEEVLFVSGSLFKTTREPWSKFIYGTINKTGENVLTPQGCEVFNLVDATKNRFIPCLASYDFHGVKLKDGSVFYASNGAGMIINSSFTEARWVNYNGIYRWNSKETNTSQYYREALLQSGKILIMGGFAYKSTVWKIDKSLDAEIYDPKTESITRIGRPKHNRKDGHTLTLLNDGSVLIVGGDGDGRQYWKEFMKIKEAELYIGEREIN